MSDERDARVDAYLNRLSHAMGGSFAEQQTVRDELLAHIREAAAALELDGIAPAEATHRVLADLGDADAVGRALRRSRGTSATRRPILQPDGAILITAHHERHLPRLPLTLAVGAIIGIPAFVALAYAWPG